MTPRNYLIVPVLLWPLAASADAPVTIEVTPVQTSVHPTDTFEVSVSVLSHTESPVSLKIMSCSWQDQWLTSDSHVVPAVTVCDKNVRTTLDLEAAIDGAGKPTGQIVRTLKLVADKAAPVGPLKFRLGFTALDAKAAVWSNDLTVQVVDVGTALKVSGKVAKHHVAFELANTTSRPIDVAEHLLLQRRVDGEWYDLTWMSASRCAYTGTDFIDGTTGRVVRGPPNTKPACTTVAPGQRISPEAWLGTTCAQCVCHANKQAEPGVYRLVARSCDGAQDFIGGDVTLGP